MANEMTELAIFSIGHSTHAYGRFLKLVRDAGVTAIADVRTAPFSRHQPQFNADALKDSLRMDGVAYSFLGKELGGRPTGRQYYCDGVADYELMANAPDFLLGISRIIEGASKYRIALMCSEHDPLDCHRCLLVGRTLSEKGLSVRHILAGGLIADQKEIEKRLLGLSKKVDDLFLSPDEQLARAYRDRSLKVAYSEQPGRSTNRAVG